jgi:hypothetical protein
LSEDSEESIIGELILLTALMFGSVELTKPKPYPQVPQQTIQVADTASKTTVSETIVTRTVTSER